ncbi:heterodimeric geranylgeranyl pyrophosphate synthase small subunit, chloroplastic-like [Coffea eugenioides]|uniref:heterodimeric geranylgeranyl pyrophosphate synthase small subunit, chloroplastic-like n=1 Tax=Coffea eugenioides TaxID=49369 RepID=UPI000F60AC23|nr:heterodimeric geranylgeranyl pyrophosphate synthase small subunit, chloroplastic-like [Coffea eugenioides]
MARALSTCNGRANLFGSSTSNLLSPSSVCYRPLVVRMSREQPYWANIEADVETHLKEAIPIRHPVSVFEPMHHLAFAAPRTTAPALCIAACELVGGHRSQAMAAASAIQLMHAAASAHERLPLTDRTRPKTKPATERKFGPNIELLTGDGIVPFGFLLLADSLDSAQNNPDRVLRVMTEIARATGSQGVVDGQFREFIISQSDEEEAVDASSIEYVSRKKEGELHACAAACGAILGGGSEAEIEKLRSYGLYAGTIQGMLFGIGRNQKGVREMVENLRALALKEVESFKNREIEAISSLVEPELSFV